MAITTVNGELDDSSIIFDRSKLLGRGRGDKINLYVDLEVINAETIDITAECNNFDIDDEYYKVFKGDGTSLTEVKYSLTDTDKYIIPITIPKEVEKIKINVDGLTDSNININVGFDNFYA